MRQALGCVVTPAAFITDFNNTDTREHELALSRNRPVRLSTPRGDVHYTFSVRQRFVMVRTDPIARGSWHAVVTSYQYALGDDEGREILAYHWHPLVGFGTPHSHLSVGAGALRPELQTAHLPTGYVPFAEVVLMLIRDFNVKARRDYRMVLEPLRTST
jgi:hypothetical protein